MATSWSPCGGICLAPLGSGSTLTRSGAIPGRIQDRKARVEAGGARIQPGAEGSGRWVGRGASANAFRRSRNAPLGQSGLPGPFCDVTNNVLSFESGGREGIG